ncbi:Uncharacterized protein TCM_031499 [Theobroma cacao]|uniref:Uncharacterized protein n=1 Tax=Theobroma cacao TaxID=3641 RepID=A0A061F7Y3_THECC|nr:Uncharacterized protein TCM_031499 [Theobroma cacao]
MQEALGSESKDRLSKDLSLLKISRCCSFRKQKRKKFSLWRIMVAAINKLNPSFMIPSRKVSNPSIFWKQISKPLLPGNNYHNFVTSRFGHSLGNGATISFCNDVWLENSTLAVIFPRIHALAVDKKATIASLGTVDK